MNQLSLSKRTQIINLLVEGNSIRTISRLTGASKNTITKLLVEVGRACHAFHNDMVVGVKSKRIHCEEIWSFVGAKEKNTTDEMKEGEYGNAWTWTALDAETNLIVSYFVGGRDADFASVFINDVAGRLATSVQLTTDGHRAYLDAVEDASDGQEDYAQLVKIYGDATGERTNERKYSPVEFQGAKKVNQISSPDKTHISTSYVERHKLTIGMQISRLTRLTNAFSKKLENHICATSLHFVYYNFCRIHKTLNITPAMEAGLTKDIMRIEDVVRLTEIYKEA